MAIHVSEIMNRELFSVSPEQPIDDALGFILALGITAAPVIDDEGAPVGVLSIRDALDVDATHCVGDEMASPVMTIPATASIVEAGRLVAETGYHHLVATDPDGRAVGMVSVIDVVRGLLGMPVVHPPQFAHRDEDTGLVWTDDVPLAADRVEAAPAGPGLILLTHTAAGVENQALWVEPARDIRARLLELVTTPEASAAGLLRVLRSSPFLCFRAASTMDLDEARAIAEEMLSHDHLQGRASAP